MDYPVAVAEPSAESDGGTRLKDDDIDHDSTIEPSEQVIIHDYSPAIIWRALVVDAMKMKKKKKS
jgi:hypothetical protein